MFAYTEADACGFGKEPGERQAPGPSTDERAAQESHLIPSLRTMVWVMTHGCNSGAMARMGSHGCNAYGRIFFLEKRKEPCLLAKTELAISPRKQTNNELKQETASSLLGFKAAASCYTNLVPHPTPD